VKVTEEMVLSVEPQFQDTPTSINRFVPEPVVWLNDTLLALASPIPLETAPSGVTGVGVGLVAVPLTATFSMAAPALVSERLPLGAPTMLRLKRT